MIGSRSIGAPLVKNKWLIRMRSSLGLSRRRCCAHFRLPCQIITLLSLKSLPDCLILPYPLSYFCVKFQYICIVVQMNVLWVFYHGCSPIEAQWCFMHIWTSDASWRSNWLLIPSSSNHLQIDAFNRFRMFCCIFHCMFIFNGYKQ